MLRATIIARIGRAHRVSSRSSGERRVAHHRRLATNENNTMSGGADDVTVTFSHN
jgi:hypothetical protein